MTSSTSDRRRWRLSRLFVIRELDKAAALGRPKPDLQIEFHFVGYQGAAQSDELAACSCSMLERPPSLSPSFDGLGRDRNYTNCCLIDFVVVVACLSTSAFSWV